MPLRSPNLDDRTFDELIDEARKRVLQVCPDWDLSPGDPATVLLEAFAYLTEVLIYRVNRVPEKAYIEFLGLLGVKVQPPTAATVKLTFTLSRPAEKPVEIPRGTRVTVARQTGSDEPPVFTTATVAVISVGETEVEAAAYNAELTEGELAGSGTGLARLSVATKRAPLVSETSEDLALVVAIEAAPERLEGRVPSIKSGGKTYRVWKEVESFAGVAPDTLAYIVDRISGIVTFAPAIRKKQADGSLAEVASAMAAVPERGKEIRLWYWRGGGSSGNVAAGSLTVLKTPIQGVSVTNKNRAAGGRAAETLENALSRGPQQFRSLERAVTAGDFKMLAESYGAVARAQAITRVEVWAHATPGTVEVLLVPEIPAGALQGPLDASHIVEYQTEKTRSDIQAVLDERRPLGTICIVSWARYKTVRVRARIVTYWEENADALRVRVLTKLYDTINPKSWRFGQPLRASRIYDIILSEPGVSYVEKVSFEVDDAPSGDVPAVVRDFFQRATWHALSGNSVYRTMNDGEGWERTGVFQGENVNVIAMHPQRAGLIALGNVSENGQDSALRFSLDDGETWSQPMPVSFVILGLAWALRETMPVLFLATSVGLYEMALDDGRAFIQVQVDPANPQRGFSAVAILTDSTGNVSLAAAAEEGAGVFISVEGGKSGSFRNAGLLNEDIRVLVPQYDGPRTFFWAGFAASAGAPGTGAARLEVLGSKLSEEGWRRFSKGWSGGSCWSLAFHGLSVYAASYQAGVLRLDASRDDASWAVPDLGCGLPQREVGRIFQWVRSTAAHPQIPMVLCGTTGGIYRSTDSGQSYRSVSTLSYSDKVTLPETWLFCSGEHTIEVVEEHAGD